MSPQHPPDRLAAILAELDEGRRTPWLPDEDDLIDRRPLFGFARRRAASSARDPAPTDEGSAGDEFDMFDQFDEVAEVAEVGEDDRQGDEPVSRADRRSRGAERPGSSAPFRPHTPLFRSPLPDTDIDARPGRSALIGAAVVLVVVAILFGFRVWAARQQAAPTPLAVPSGVASSGASGSPAAKSSRTSDVPSGQATRAAGGGASSTSPGTTSGSVLVHVIGQVRHPGVVRLVAGSRVDDAIRAAGGSVPSADLSAVNLARPLSDGEQVFVPKPGEAPRPAAGAVGGPASGGAAGPAGGGAGSGSSKAGAAAGPIDLNSASEADFDTLPGVGPVLASRIVAWRTANGRFTSVDDLGEVSGIGDKLLERLRPLVTV